MPSAFHVTERWIAPLRRGLRADTTLDDVVTAEAEDDPERVELAGAFGLLQELGRVLLGYGLPAQRLEEALGRLADALGLRLDCFSTPTALILTLDDGERARTRVVRAEPGEVDLERLGALHALVGRVERGELSPAEAARRVPRIVARAARYPTWASVAASTLVAAVSSILLGGAVHDIGPATVLGLMVGLLGLVARRAPTFARLLPAVAAALATFGARAFGLALPVHEPILALSAVVALLPGFTLTVASMELATANLVSGASRLAGAIATLLQLGFGAALGHHLAEALPAGLASSAPPLPEGAIWAAHAFGAVAFGVLLRAGPRDLPAIVGAALIGVASARLGRLGLGPELGALAGGVTLGVLAHLHARHFDRPALLLLSPSVMLLVPGSLGFLSVASMLEADVIEALQTGFRMTLVATSLAAGVLMASVAVPPRRAL